MRGFQRMVNETRSKQIARTVLDRNRAFPNAITLATNLKNFKFTDGEIAIPDKVKFLVVDGQHRLWAQKFSDMDGQYVCIIHLNKSEREMAELFLEINDNQRRVPSSLRWDLVRLVRPVKDEARVIAADLVFELATREDSPFFYSIDLTGERPRGGYQAGFARARNHDLREQGKQNTRANSRPIYIIAHALFLGGSLFKSGRVGRYQQYFL